MQFLRAQGATEYLVLLAVVLIVALVSVALLGFFPGMASDAQVTQAQIYWSSASPIAIIETSARTVRTNPAAESWFYLKLRNTGSYPIRITGLIGADGGKSTVFFSDVFPACGTPSAGNYNLSGFLYMAPGEETFIGWTGVTGFACDREMAFRAASTTAYYVGGAASVCQNSSASPGMVIANPFGFEYIQYIDGQQITKREVGAKSLVIKCREPY